MNRPGLILLATFAFGTPAHAASFACEGVLSAGEAAICGDPTLSQLDDRLDDAYSTAFTSVSDDPAATEELRSAQRHWLVQRQTCLAETGCIRQAYESRIAALESLSGIRGRGPAPEAEDPSVQPHAGAQLTPSQPGSSVPSIRHLRPSETDSKSEPATGSFGDATDDRSTWWLYGLGLVVVLSLGYAHPRSRPIARWVVRFGLGAIGLVFEFFFARRNGGYTRDDHTSGGRKAIASAVQRGNTVYVYDDQGFTIASIPAGFDSGDGLVGFTSTRVSIRKGNRIYMYDSRGFQQSSVQA